MKKPMKDAPLGRQAELNVPNTAGPSDLHDHAHTSAHVDAMPSPNPQAANRGPYPLTITVMSNVLPGLPPGSSVASNTNCICVVPATVGSKVYTTYVE